MPGSGVAGRCSQLGHQIVSAARGEFKAMKAMKAIWRQARVGLGDLADPLRSLESSLMTPAVSRWRYGP